MTPDLDTLRLRALAVAGVARLADHHDGLGPRPSPGTSGALRVFDGHVEIDFVLVVGHAVPTTTAALRAALAPYLGGRAVHATVVDVDLRPSDHRPRGAQPPDQQPRDPQPPEPQPRDPQP